MLLGELAVIKKLLPGALQTKQKLISPRVDLCELEVVQCFHVSFRHNRESIQVYGLVPRGKPAGDIISYSPRIFVATTYEDIAFDYVGYEDVDVWAFYLPKKFLCIDESSSYGNHYYITELVPWYRLSLFESW